MTHFKSRRKPARASPRFATFLLCLAPTRPLTISLRISFALPAPNRRFHFRSTLISLGHARICSKSVLLYVFPTRRTPFYSASLRIVLVLPCSCSAVSLSLGSDSTRLRLALLRTVPTPPCSRLTSPMTYPHIEPTEDDTNKAVETNSAQPVYVGVRSCRIRFGPDFDIILLISVIVCDARIAEHDTSQHKFEEALKIFLDTTLRGRL